MAGDHVPAGEEALVDRARDPDRAEDVSAASGTRGSPVTVRSVALGLAAAAGIAYACFFIDTVVRQGMFIPNQMPTAVYGGLALLVLAVNPLLALARRRWALSKGELAVICGLALVAGSVASWGLWQFLPSTLMMPHHHVKTIPGWAEADVLGLPPPEMLPDVSADPEGIVNGYVTGLSEANEHVSFGDVPWGAWWRTLLFWVPLGLSITIAVVGLGVVITRQWSRHELLSYPISTFASSLLPERGEAVGRVFRDYLFWAGAGVVFVLHVNNYLARWWPQTMISVPLSLDFGSLSVLLPTFMKGVGSWVLLRPTITFTIVGLAYFLRSDVSFSMGMMPFVFCYAYGIAAAYGISMQTGDHMSANYEGFLFVGGYVAILCIVIYGGRRFYLAALRKSVGLATPDRVDSDVVWGMRVFLAGTLAFFVQLVVVGLEWDFALIYTVLALMTWIVVSRIVAETGAFHIGTQIFPGAVLLALLGPVALGPRMLVIAFLVTAVLLAGPGWGTMPFTVQALKLGEMSGVRTGRLAQWAIAAVVLCTLICVPVSIYWQHDQGATATTSGWPMMVSKFSFDNALRVRNRLVGQGSYETAESLSGFRRLLHIRPKWSCLGVAMISFAGAILFYVARLRFPRWPLHPVAFVFLCGYQASLMAGSFLIGWLIKHCVTRYGGNAVYERLKPLMIGLIAGELLGELVPMVVGLIYFAMEGHAPFAA